TGVLRSRNAGRDWSREASNVPIGAVFAAAIASDGRRALVSTASEIFRSDADNDWRPTRAPRGAVPARAIARGAAPGRAYLAGWTGLARRDDRGASWSDAAAGLPRPPVPPRPGTPPPPRRARGGAARARPVGAGTAVRGIRRDPLSGAVAPRGRRRRRVAADRRLEPPRGRGLSDAARRRRPHGPAAAAAALSSRAPSMS